MNECYLRSCFVHCHCLLLFIFVFLWKFKETLKNFDKYSLIHIDKIQTGRMRTNIRITYYCWCPIRMNSNQCKMSNIMFDNLFGRFPQDFLFSGTLWQIPELNKSKNNRWNCLFVYFTSDSLHLNLFIH